MNDMGSTIIIILVVLIVLLAFIVVAMYNSLVGRRNQIANAEGSIDAMLKKRFDLIPNLVDTCKVYLSQKKMFLIVWQN